MTKLVTIHGWVARDLHFSDASDLYVGQNKPTRYDNGDGSGLWTGFGEWVMSLPKEMFPEITWEDEPVEVEIIIRRKED